MRTKLILIIISVTLFSPFSDSNSQIVYNQPYSASLDFHYVSWDLDNGENGFKNSLSQQAVSISGFLPIRDNFEARYFMATASNDLEMNSNESELSGLGDMRIQLSHSFARDRVLLSAGVNLPTGKQELDAEEGSQIIEFLSRDYLSFPLRRYGEGTGFNLLAGGATRLGPVKCGMNASYYYAGTYEPYENYGDYDPGNTFSLGATANFDIKNMACSARFTYLYSDTDRLDKDDIYRQAPQFLTYLSASYRKQSYSATFGTRVILRGRNTRYSLIDGVIESQLKKYGDEFDFFARFDYITQDRWRIVTHASTRQISSGEEAMDRSSIYNLGMSLSKQFMDHYNIGVGGIYYLGSTDRDDTDINGFQASASVSVAY